MTHLLDVSVLLAWLWHNHADHGRVLRWAAGAKIAVCPLTELGFLRISTQPALGATMADARKMLAEFTTSLAPAFVPCDERALDGPVPPTSGRVTDFYLASLAESYGMRLATLDKSIGHPAADIVP